MWLYLRYTAKSHIGRFITNNYTKLGIDVDRKVPPVADQK